MSRKVYVIGVGMTKFEKPGSKEWDYPDMAKEAGTKALEDAGIPYSEVEQAVVGYVYGESTCGQRAVYQLGLTGIPVYNVNNNCSTGSTALFMGKQLVEGGLSDCVLALGFEKMQKGSLGATFTDRINPMDKHVNAMVQLRGFEPHPPAAQLFGNAGREHMEKYGSTPMHFAKIGYKNHKHSVNNPYSQFQDEYSIEDILAAPMVHEPLTKLQCCPTSDGSGAAVLASEEFVKKHNLQDKAIEILAQTMVTDTGETFDSKSSIKLIGSEMTRLAAEPGLRADRPRPGGRRRHRAPRLLLRQRDDHLRGSRPRGGGHSPQARRRGRLHLRRQSGRQSLGRPHLEGPPSRRHRPRPVLRAHLAAAGDRRTSGRWRARRSRCSTTSASAARSSSRCTGRAS